MVLLHVLQPLAPEGRQEVLQRLLDKNRLNTGWYFFLAPPPNFTMSQAHYEFLYLEHFRGGPVQIIKGLGLSQIRGGPEKKTTL